MSVATTRKSHGRKTAIVGLPPIETVSAPARDINGGRGETSGDTETSRATSPRDPGNGDTMDATDGRFAVPDPAPRECEPLPDTEPGAALSRRLQSAKRSRDEFLKSRIGLENRLASAVARKLGYFAGMTPAERKAQWTAAKAIVLGVAKSIRKQNDPIERMRLAFVETAKAVPAGTAEDVTDFIASILSAALPSIAAFDDQAHRCELLMQKLVKQLPAWRWCEPILGVGALTLANIIGETGDLSLYANPAKVWKRMGCAPYEKGGESHSGKAWKIDGWHKAKMAADDWEAYGYCGRRKSVIYNLALGIKMACAGKNGDKEAAKANVYAQRYRAVYDGWKATYPERNHFHIEHHAFTLCGKMFLRDLWVEWTRKGA